MRRLYKLNFETLSSTQDKARALTPNLSEIFCILAAHQSEGRGTRGRMWVAEPNQALLMSLAFQTKLESNFLPFVNLVGAMSLYKTLSSKLNLWKAGMFFKWPNDLYYKDSNQKFYKIGGLLAEAQKRKIVMGLGLNLYSSPKDLPAMSLRDLFNDFNQTPMELGSMIAECFSTELSEFEDFDEQKRGEYFKKIELGPMKEFWGLEGHTEKGKMRAHQLNDSAQLVALDDNGIPNTVNSFSII